MELIFIFLMMHLLLVAEQMVLENHLNIGFQEVIGILHIILL